MSQILVIEDDPAIRRGVVDALRFRGHTQHEASTVSAGRQAALTGPCDLVLLDLVLPDGVGWEVLSDVRQARPDLPIIMLTARGDERDRVAGLQGGADDYVVKPFSIKELLARIDAVLRRAVASRTPLPSLPIPGGQIDLATARIVFDDSDPVDLSAREVDLLTYLAQAGGRIVTRDELLRHVWNLDPCGLTTRTIDMHVLRLREKLRDSGMTPQVLLTVRGKGYRWDGDLSQRTVKRTVS